MLLLNVTIVGNFFFFFKEHCKINYFHDSVSWVQKGRYHMYLLLELFQMDCLINIDFM